MAVTLTSFSYSNNGGIPDNQIIMTEPAGAAQGDVLVSVCVLDTSATISSGMTGWTSVTSGSSLTPQFRYSIKSIVRGASAPNLTWGFSASVAASAYCICLSGVNGEVENSAFAANGSARAPNPPSVAASAANTAFVLAVGMHQSGNAWSAPSGYTMVDGGLNFDRIALAYKTLSASAAEDPGAFGDALDVQDIWAATLTFLPVGYAPSVSTFAATNITPTTATGNGNIDDDGGYAVTRGVCWSTSALPTTSDSTATTSNGGIGPYSVSMTGLSNNTTYHMRAYAINSYGTAYGPDKTMISNGGSVYWIKQS